MQTLKEVQIPKERVQEAENEVLVLKEEIRLLEELHHEELLVSLYVPIFKIGLARICFVRPW